MGGMGARMGHTLYREPSKPEEPLTDAEMALWDATFAAVAGRAHFNCDSCVSWADWVVKQRRKKFGVR